MAYCAHDEVERLVGPQPFLEMLDDDLDGAEDAGLFDRIVPDLVLLGIAAAVRLNKERDKI